MLPSSVVWGQCAVMLFSVSFPTEKYTEFRDWEGTLITEPPMAMTISDEGLEGVRVAPLTVLRYRTYGERGAGSERCHRSGSQTRERDAASWFYRHGAQFVIVKSCYPSKAKKVHGKSSSGRHVVMWSCDVVMLALAPTIRYVTMVTESTARQATRAAELESRIGAGRSRPLWLELGSELESVTFGRLQPRSGVAD